MFRDFCSVKEYQGPVVALALAGAVVLILMYLDKVYGDHAPAPAAKSDAPHSPKTAKAPSRQASAVKEEEEEESDRSDLSRNATENLSAAGSEEGNLSPCVKSIIYSVFYPWKIFKILPTRACRTQAVNFALPQLLWL